MSTTWLMSDGDYDIDPTGGQTEITGATKGAQDLLEELFLPFSATENRGNELFSADGSVLPMAFSPILGLQTIEAMFRAAVQRFMQRQAEDSNTDETERIQRLDKLVVKPLPNKAFSVFVFILVIINDKQIGVLRNLSLNHLGSTPIPLLGGYDQ